MGWSHRHPSPRFPAPASVTVLACILLILPSASLATHAGLHAFEQRTTLRGSTGQQLGTALAADTDVLVAGGSGSVHIYERSPGSWSLSQELSAPPNPYTDDGNWGWVNGQDFGNAVDVDASAGVLAIGAPGLDVTGNVTDHETDAGAVYVYDQEPNGTWNLTATFLGPVDGDWNDQETPGNDNLGPAMGFSVAVRGDTIVAGAPFAVVNGTPLRGVADVYERTGDDAWERTARLASPSPAADKWDLFGFDVAAVEDRFAVGAPGETSGTGNHGGAVHVYEASANTWEHTQRVGPALAYEQGTSIGIPSFLAGDVKNAGFFGTAVDFDADGTGLTVGEAVGNRLVDLFLPGQPEVEVPFVARLRVPIPWGSAHVFETASDGYAHEATMKNPDREAGSRFGYKLSINKAGNQVLVGATLANQTDGASVTVNGERVSTPDIVSDQGVVTHHPATGAAYVFEKTSSGWACSAQLSGTDTAHGDQLGASVAFTGSTVFVGAPLAGPSSFAGQVYGFTPAGQVERPASLPDTDIPQRCGPAEQGG